MALYCGVSRTSDNPFVNVDRYSANISSRSVCGRCVGMICSDGDASLGFILDVALVERQVIGILQFGSLRTLVIDRQVRGHKVVGVTTVQRGHLELYSGTNARPGWRQGLLREQFTELIVPWGNTTPGPPTHPSLLLVLFLNMEVNRGT